MRSAGPVALKTVSGIALAPLASSRVRCTRVPSGSVQASEGTSVQAMTVPPVEVA